MNSIRVQLLKRLPEAEQTFGYITKEHRQLYGFEPDIPEAITCGDTEKDALRNAVDALETALDFYFEKNRPVPMPSIRKRGQHMVELPASVSAKVLLFNGMLLQQVRPAELAKRLDIPRQHVNRLLDPRHATKIDGIAAALKVLGKTLEIRAVEDDAVQTHRRIRNIVLVLEPNHEQSLQCAEKDSNKTSRRDLETAGKRLTETPPGPVRTRTSQCGALYRPRSFCYHA
jgi:antitoxin HicB